MKFLVMSYQKTFPLFEPSLSNLSYRTNRKEVLFPYGWNHVKTYET